jgi:hypothetical protein
MGRRIGRLPDLSAALPSRLAWMRASADRTGCGVPHGCLDTCRSKIVDTQGDKWTGG